MVDIFTMRFITEINITGYKTVHPFAAQPWLTAKGFNKNIKETEKKLLIDWLAY